MFSTSDRYPAASRWVRESSHRQRNPMGTFLASIDIMIYVAGAALAGCVLAMILN